jgi:hypothetical protein
VRPDCIYTWNGHDFERRSDSQFHDSPSDLIHDLGEPPTYKRANVLLSEGSRHFRYFRDKPTVEYKKRYPLLKSLIERLGRGHRVNFGEELHEELKDFIKRVWAAPSAYQETILADGPCRDKCSNDDEDYASGEC